MPYPTHRRHGDEPSTIALAALLAVCCVGPVLLVAGIAGWIRSGPTNPWVITDAVLLTAAAGATLLFRRSHR
ncbi:hypothetical protein [Streptomyces sp. CC228A]|uniref:hypothetical protein n=1 Tax=Streptomyces sp. CC228A TaxID=2898186 RepID=UPI001F1A7497|nr:hypothetical protein [Streptomyces sp. CC228A]